ncbi:amidohydrolase family protein [Streptomyces sp. NPDC014870]|uniref:amidohydrolase family protein n=1 Tax=Streptomyces sp. NPDC014870 TaxID=3364925 RepID=UPI0037022FBE
MHGGIVDAHHHVWDLGARDQPWLADDEMTPLRRNFTLADLAPETGAAGVTSTVLVQTVTTAEETPELLALAGAHDLVAGVVGWTDLTAPDVADELARLRELPGGNKLVGIRHQIQSEPDPLWILRRDVLRGLDAVASAGLAYDLVIRPHQLPAATSAAFLLPHLTFVLDHLGKPPVATGERNTWARHLHALATLPHTTAKLSGLVTEARWDSWTPDDLRPYTETALEVFGPDRLMFGSDWPVCLLASSYGEVVTTAHELTADLTEPERTAVFSGTAKRVYGLR